MAKTITIRVDDNVYQLFKTSAAAEKRTISNMIEYAALNFLTDEMLITDEEMQEILNDPYLLATLQKAKKDVKKGRYKIVA
jgi:predicted transcriptional regulator